jgi:hypothetical protein
MTATYPTTPWPSLPCGTVMCDMCAESPVVTGSAVQAATNTLWSLTGMRFGTTQVKLRPCVRACMLTSFPGYGWDPWPGTYGWGALAYAGGGWWPAVGVGCGSCGDDCNCGTLSEIVLPAPVNQIIEVKVDGAVITGSAYRLDNNRRLVRLDGKLWPYCQALRLADTQPGTLSVTATYGEDVPPDAAWAVTELACEFIRSAHGEDCNLPPNVVALTQQGVSITMPDLTTAFAEHRLTGLRRVDMFVRTYNPAGIHRRARAYSVDRTPFRRVSS